MLMASFFYYFFLLGALLMAMTGSIWMALVLIVLKISITPHLVTVLLSLEVLSLSTLFSGICLTFGSSLMSSFVLAFFTMIVCEACIGLGVLVMSSRSQGSDKILSMY